MTYQDTFYGRFSILTMYTLDILLPDETLRTTSTGLAMLIVVSSLTALWA